MREKSRGFQAGVILAVMLSAALSAGCADRQDAEGDTWQQLEQKPLEGSPEESAQPGNQENTEDAGAERQLTPEELEWFTAYMNQGENNGFLLSEYEEPGKADMNEVLYNGAGMDVAPLSEEERRAYEAAGYSVETDITRLTTEQIEAFLQRKMGIGVGDMARGLDWVYLKEYDSYVFQHGDTNFAPFLCTEGRQTGGDRYEIHCESDDDYVSDCVVALRKAGEDYLFVSNRFVDKAYAMESGAGDGEDGSSSEWQTEAGTETDPEPAKRLEGLNRPEDSNRPDDEISKQLEIFAREKEQWIYKDYDSFAFGYTVHDLDGDGRLELVTQITAGTGLFSENHFYRVNEAGDGIEELPQEYYEQYAELDLGGMEGQALREKDGSTVHYLASDVTRNGYAEGACWDGAFYLKDGCVYSEVFRGRYWLVQEDESMQETYYDEAGNEIGKEDWEQLYEDFCADKEAVADGLNWATAYPEEAGEASVEEILEELERICAR